MRFPKKIRLPESLYQEEGRVCLITICARNRELIFGNVALGLACVDLLKTCAENRGITIYVYCFMPDHVHLLLAPSAGGDVIGFVRGFKGASTRLAWRFGIGPRLWQRSFYDHFLRREEVLENTAQYILNNPVRKGMVERYQDYPLAGSWALQLDL